MQYDIISKCLSERFTADFAELILGRNVRAIEVLPRELPLTEHRSDGLARIAEEDQEFILHIEFQTSHDPKMPARMLSYYVRIMDKYDLPVYPVVIYLNPKDANKTIENTHTSFIRSKQILTFNYEVIKTWELDANTIFDNRLYGLYPLAALANDAKLSDCVEKVKSAVNDKYLDDDAYVCTRVFAELKYSKEVIKNMLTDDLIERSEMYREIMGKGVKKGMEKGMEDSIVSVLITRFGEIPDRLAQRIYHIRDNTVLKDMLKLAVTSRDISEFERKMSA